MCKRVENANTVNCRCSCRYKSCQMNKRKEYVYTAAAATAAAAAAGAAAAAIYSQSFLGLLGTSWDYFWASLDQKARLQTRLSSLSLTEKRYCQQDVKGTIWPFTQVGNISLSVLINGNLKINEEFFR